MSAMEFYNDTCSLCGRSTSNAEPASAQVIDGTRYFFDTTTCLATFRKFQEVYGKTFPTLVYSNYRDKSEWLSCIRKNTLSYFGIVALTAVAFLITLDFMYSQSSGQINTGFNTYENDIHKVRIQYPSNWEQIPNSMIPPTV